MDVIGLERERVGRPGISSASPVVAGPARRRSAAPAPATRRGRCARSGTAARLRRTTAPSVAVDLGDTTGDRRTQDEGIPGAAPPPLRSISSRCASRASAAFSRASATATRGARPRRAAPGRRARPAAARRGAGPPSRPRAPPAPRPRPRPATRGRRRRPAAARAVRAPARATRDRRPTAASSDAKRPSAGAATIASPPVTGSSRGTRIDVRTLAVPHERRRKRVRPLLFLQIGDRRRIVFGRFPASAACGRLVGEHRGHAEIVPIGQPGRIDDQRPPVAASRRQRAFDTERAGPERLRSRQRGRPSRPPPASSRSTAVPLRRAEVGEAREVDGKPDGLPGDERRVLHVELGLRRSSSSRRASAASARPGCAATVAARACALSGQRRAINATVAFSHHGISHPLANSSSISACRTAASSVACRSRAGAPVRYASSSSRMPALARVVADLRDALEARAVAAWRRDTVGRLRGARATHRAKRGDLRAQRPSERPRRALRPAQARPRQRVFRLRPIEQRNRDVDAEDAADVAAAQGRRLGAGDDLGLGNRAADRPRAAQMRRTRFRAAAPPVHREAVSACAISNVHGGSGGARHRSRTTATSVVGCRRRRRRTPPAPACAAHDRRGHCPVGLDIQHLAFGAKPVVAGRVAGAFRASRARRPARAAGRARRRVRFRAPAPRRGRHRRDAAPREPARTSSSARRCLPRRAPMRRSTSSSSASGDRQRLRHHHHVLGDARHRFAVERQARIRPAPGGQHVRAREIDAGANRANAWAVG